jgi:hypothetical protein
MMRTEPEVGELRFIARLITEVVPNEEPFGKVSNTADSSETVEGSDVVSTPHFLGFIHDANRTNSSSSTVKLAVNFTRPNALLMTRFTVSGPWLLRQNTREGIRANTAVKGVSGDSIRVCMIMPGTAYETSAGGPFHRFVQPLRRIL